MFVEPFRPGTMIDDKYRLVESVGGGGMGHVWKARDVQHHHRPVAIKFVARGKYGDDPEKRERFRQEMQALARLDHAHIVHLIEFNETPEGTPYLVMNFVSGGSLEKRLKQGRLDAATRDRVLKELCDALDYAHSQEVVHRDLKPANILFDASDHVRISDFGLAKLLDATDIVSVLAGTRGFQSPEQCKEALVTLERGEEPTIDQRADIYALGVIAWILFTGQHPDDPPSSSADRLSPDVEQVLRKAFAYHREDRYNSAGEFWKALTSAMPRERRPPIWVFGGVGGLVLLLAAAGAWLMRPGLGAAPKPTLTAAETTTTLAIGTSGPTDTPTSISPTATPSATPWSAPSSMLTGTPSSAPTPTPYLVVSDDKVSIYDGPGQEYRIQKRVVKGDMLPILGRSEDGVWLYVDYLGWSLWIAVQSVTTDVDIQTLPTVKAPPTPVDRPPVIKEISMVSTDIDACSAISVTCEASDLDDELTYTWETSDGFITGEGDSVTYNAPEVVGSQMVTVTIQDEYGREVKRSIQVEIMPAHPPPGRSEPVGVLGQIWHECGIRRKLGWAIGEEHATPGAQQSFKQGVMFWRQDTDEIYVLTHGGNWQVYMDTWEEGMDEYSCPDLAPRKTPPTPVRGFGKVWCERLGGPYAAIGGATSHEQGYQAHWQRLEHGLMGQGLDGHVYVLHEDYSWQSYPSPSNGGSSNCPGAPPQRVRVGDSARVCTAYHQLVARVQPGSSSPEVTRLEPGEHVTVVDGPACADGWSWWEVRTDSGAVGWVSEGGDDVDPYFICPER